MAVVKGLLPTTGPSYTIGPTKKKINVTWRTSSFPAATNEHGRDSTARNVYSSSPTSSTSKVEESGRNGIVKVDCMISGGGPAGLLSAIMMAQKFPEVSTLVVFKRVIFGLCYSAW